MVTGQVTGMAPIFVIIRQGHESEVTEAIFLLKAKSLSIPRCVKGGIL